MQDAPRRPEIPLSGKMNIAFGRAIGNLYRLLFQWWLDVPVARRAQERFAQEIREALPFLFADLKGQIVPNQGVRFPPGFDYAFVTVAVGNLLLRFCRGRGQFRVDLAPSDSGREWQDWKDIEAVLMVLDSSGGGDSRPSIRNFRDTSRILRTELPRLQEATSEGQWDLVKRKVNALCPLPLRIR